jgi:hypothetical protein
MLVYTLSSIFSSPFSFWKYETVVSYSLVRCVWLDLSDQMAQHLHFSPYYSVVFVNMTLA